ncbi:MAG TPA: 50S ribosomal protein L24 [Polyangiaceae bacterium]|nr:50S ribosomal protein L24 [Polyangiaceae bacterium]
MMQRVRTGDTVLILSGEDKGKRGKVSKVLLDRGLVVVEGVNRVKRHIRPTQQRAGGILEVEAPIDVSKVKLVDAASGKAGRVKFQIEDGKKVRVVKGASPAAEK